MLRSRMTSLRRPPFNYVAAALFAGLAFAIRLSLQPILEDRSPYLLFVFGVALTAIYSGFGPAILAMLAGLVLSLGFFVPTRYHLLPSSNAEVVQALTYVLASAVVIVLAEAAERDRQKTYREAERFRFLTEQAREYAVITTDSKGMIVGWTKGAEHLFGHTTGEAIGKYVALIFTEEDRIRKIPELEMQQAAAQGHAPGERWHMRKDGSRFFGLGILVPLRNDIGDVVEFAKILRDGTHIKQREEQLARQAQRSELALTETTEQVDAFTYTVAHDLRAPLRAMDGYAKALRDEFHDRLGTEGGEYVSRILASAHRMDELVTDLLEFWRLARMKERCVQVDANTVLDRVLSDRAPEIRAKQAKIDRERALPPIHGQPECLYKAFSHLVSNALKFSTNTPPQIQIGFQQRDGHVRIYFRDNGPGIPPEYHKKIFKVFERISKDKPGTGIGLSIVHKCVELMDGRVGVDSEPGEGSCFWMDLHPAKHAGHD